MAKTAKRKRNLFEGEVETCCHRVAFWYDLEKLVLADEDDNAGPHEKTLSELLTDEAEDRAKTCIIDGCHSGELNCYYVDAKEKEHEIRGWWEINRD